MKSSFSVRTFGNLMREVKLIGLFHSVPKLKRMKMGEMLQGGLK